VSESDEPGASSTESLEKPLSPAGENAVGRNLNTASIEPMITVAALSVFQRCSRHQRTRPRYQVMIRGVVTGSSCGFRKYRPSSA